jgi:long-chain acyl-CoA synthetase
MKAKEKAKAPATKGTAKEAYLSKPWLKHYPKGVPAEVDAPLISVPELFEQAADKYRDKTALLFYGKKLTYAELKDQIDRLATALADLGIKKGDTVALYLLNSPQYVISFFACLKVGAKITPVSPIYTSIEIKHQLEDSEAQTIICQNILYDNVEKTGLNIKNKIVTSISEYLPALKRALGKSVLGKVYAEMDVPTPKLLKGAGHIQFQDLIKKYPPQPPRVKIDPKTDLSALPYTGGTTGLPKAAMLTHYNMVSVVTQVTSFFPLFEKGKEVILAFLPFFHIYGLVVVMLAGLSQGDTLVLFTTPDVDGILTAVERYQASGFYGVPTLFDYLNQHEKTDLVDWKRIKVIACGADTLHESILAAWERRTGTDIMEGYGMTETTGVSHSSPPNRPKKGAFGLPLPSMNAAVVGVDNTEFVPVESEGELILNGPNIMQGYWKRPEETKAALIELEGKRWLRTGDIVRMDKEGYFHFFDRKKDLIKYKGYSVFARHVEDVLYSHPQIKAAAVVGVPDPQVGHIIKAYVVLEADARGRVSEQEIIDYCKERLAPYKVPKIIEFRSELPKTDVGKVSHRELREEAEAAS